MFADTVINPPSWVFVVAIVLFVLILLVAGIVHVLTVIAGAATGVATIKNLLSIKQMLAGRQVAVPASLDRPIDLVGPTLLTGAATYPLMGRVMAVIAAVLLARKGGNTLPQQYVTPQLATRWPNHSVPLPPGLFMVTELHARPLADGTRMLVWFTARGQAHTFVEYWTFACTAPLAFPVKCPTCGAPTAGNNTNSCRFCTAELAEPVANATKYWLVDDISPSPPANTLAA